MKQILGLDLGVGSIGWAVIRWIDEQSVQIIGMGSRVVPLDSDETTGFTKGNGESKCHIRTMKRSMRRNLDRFQQRRKMLGRLMEELGLRFGPELLRLSPLELWQLRADAAAGVKMSAAQLGRIIYHINMRRGYKHGKGEPEDAAEKKKQSDYLAQMSGRAKEAAEAGQTPGQYFAAKLRESAYTTQAGGVCCTYRVKEQTFPRHAYEDELKRILEAQKSNFADILTDDNISRVFSTIFYQRPLKSCKHLVSLCEFESREVTDNEGKTHIVGPRVAPTSSPLAQECRLWEAINNIVLVNNRNRKMKGREAELALLPGSEAKKLAYEYPVDKSDRFRIYDFLNGHEHMKGADLLKLLGLKKDDGFVVPAQVTRGLKGNTTRHLLAKALGDWPGADALLRFEIKIDETGEFDEATGLAKTRVSNSYLREPLYQLWHTCYSVSDPDEFAKAMLGKFGIDDPEVVERLFNVDFRGQGYASKSAKMMTKIIPWMRNDGFIYSDACEMAGYNHSSYVTAEENAVRQLLDKLPPIPKGELRQPVVEKILNQMVNVVNAAVEAYGPMDAIHVELARELRRSKDERVSDTKRNSRREKDNKRIADLLVEKGLKATRTQIQKYRMLEENGHCCMYCGAPINDIEFLRGIEADREHVIPRSLFFDDSFSNKVCSCRRCNAAKGQMTAYDFIAAQGDEALRKYINRVDSLYDRYKKSKGADGISKTKHSRLLTSLKDIPQDFIDRDLRLTQYISRKALDMLGKISRDVVATTGSVTDFFRHAWGYDEILHSLNFARYDKAGQTETVEITRNGQTHTEQRITGWTKRLDHRHHAIDALTVALTGRPYIQRLNTLSARKAAGEEGEAAHEEHMGNLSKWAARQPHPSTAEVAGVTAGIAVSFKAGKKVTTPGKRYVQKGSRRVLAQDGLLIPRGELTEDYVYGKHRVSVGKRPLKYLFNNPKSIASKRIREAIELRLKEYGGDTNKALRSCVKRPLYANSMTAPITEANCSEQRFVIRRSLSKITLKNYKDIADGAIKAAIERRLKGLDGSGTTNLTETKIFRDSQQHFPIHSVRVIKNKGMDAATPIRKNSVGKIIGYAMYGNNHHVALYENSGGKIEESIVPFAEAVRRRLLGLPVVVENPDSLWDMVQMRGDELPDDLLSRFPSPGSRFVMSMQLNEMFLLGLSDDDIRYLASVRNYSGLASHLYRVQQLSSEHYEFNFHVSTLSSCDGVQIANGNHITIQSLNTFATLNPVKVKVDILGRIILPDSYVK
ncbi:MAG: type II CRISPR RNA-guided endonuclease Cas9 [Paramuribaculum sp.]|nr:type II CRISPR RNA-guided endonuclease Cas9 [Paramuribaculum sp.]